jgi:predicted exporter
MRRYGALIALAAVVAAGGYYALRHISLDSDYSAFLPRGTSEAQRTLIRELREGLGSRVVLVALDGAAPSSLAQTSRALVQALLKTENFRYANNGEAELGERELTLITANRYALSDRLDAGEPFSKSQLRSALEDRLESLSGSAGIVEKRFLASDPTAETLRVLAHLVPPKTPQRIDGVWFDAQGRRA